MSTDDTAPITHPKLVYEPDDSLPYSLRMPNGALFRLTEEQAADLQTSVDKARGRPFKEDTGDTIDRLGLVLARGGGAWTVEGPAMARGDTLAAPRARGLHLRVVVQAVSETMARLEREGWSKR